MEDPENDTKERSRVWTLVDLAIGLGALAVSVSFLGRAFHHQ